MIAGAAAASFANDAEADVQIHGSAGADDIDANLDPQTIAVENKILDSGHSTSAPTPRPAPAPTTRRRSR